MSACNDHTLTLAHVFRVDLMFNRLRISEENSKRYEINPIFQHVSESLNPNNLGLTSTVFGTLIMMPCSLNRPKIDFDLIAYTPHVDIRCIND